MRQLLTRGRRRCVVSMSPPAVLSAVLTAIGWAAADDSPQWGQAWGRNMASAETGLPDRFDPDSGLNVRWSVSLGTETHSTPVVAEGRILIGTNNGNPRDPKHREDRGVLMCFREADGGFLWQSVVPKRTEDRFFDWPLSGMSSPATVEDGLAYIVNNRGEVMCLDLDGMADGNDGPFTDEGRHMAPAELPAMSPSSTDADIVWIFDLTEGAGIWSHDAAHSSILIDGPWLYLNSGTGVDNTHKAIRRPEAPSLVVLDKRTGALVAREAVGEGIGPDIFHCTWSAPSLGTGPDGRRLVFFAAGNGVVFGFRPLDREPGASASDEIVALEREWRFDFDPASPKKDVHRFNGNRLRSPSNFFGMPVFHDGRLFVAGGGDLWWGKNEAWLSCLDAFGSGDVTGSAERWRYPLNRHVMATPAVHDGLVFLADTGRAMHCVDAATGEACWTHDVEGEVWASALVADGKVYVGTRRGFFYVFAASREKRLLSEMRLSEPISATPVAANGVLYVATMNTLFAVGGTPAP